MSLPPFDVVISTEVVEHCYAPRLWAAAAYASLKPGGLILFSTPYHGYLKNCALALTGKLDAHFTALWEGGHIKFWSRRSLAGLLSEAGFVKLHFCRCRPFALVVEVDADGRPPLEIGSAGASGWLQISIKLAVGSEATHPTTSTAFRVELPCQRPMKGGVWKSTNNAFWQLKLTAEGP